MEDAQIIIFYIFLLFPEKILAKVVVLSLHVTGTLLSYIYLTEPIPELFSTRSVKKAYRGISLLSSRGSLTKFLVPVQISIAMY